MVKFKPIAYLVVLAALIHLVLVYFGKRAYDGGSLYRLVGLGYPFLFYLKKGKYLAMSICLMAVYTSYSVMAGACVVITYLTIFYSKKLLVGVLILLLLSPAVRNPNSVRKLYHRAEIWNYTVREWNNKLLGHGFGSFQKLNKKWGDKYLRRSHSDLLQGLYELGVIRMLPIVVLVILPIMWIKKDPISASYLCVLFQGLGGFPLHRLTTGFFSLLVIFLMWGKRWTFSPSLMEG